MARKKKAISSTPTGQVPGNNPKEFKQIFEMICEDYEVNLNTDQIAVNRMASTIMHIRKCEEIIAQKGHALEDANGEIKVNPFSYYMNQLNSELRSYMRLLKPKKKEGNAEPQSFAALLANAKQVKEDE